jgi:hypothetical protein
MGERSTALAEHLRTVHLTLQLVALVLFVAALEVPKAPFQRAFDDSMGILYLSEHFSAWNKLPFDRATSLAEHNSHHFALRIVIEPKDKVIVEALRNAPQLASWNSLDLSDQVLLVTVSDPLHPTGLNDDHRLPFKTLDEFETFWDTTKPKVYQLSYVDEDSLKCTGHGQTLAKSRIRIEPLDRLANPTDIVSPFGHIQYNGWTIEDKDEAIPVGSVHFEMVMASADCAVRIRLRQLDIDGRDEAAVVAGRQKVWTRDSYNMVFSDLSEQTKNIAQLPVRNISDEMRKRLVLEGERFEVFGAKIPAELITILGPVLLLLCEMYLILHLREFRRTIESGPLAEVPSGYVGFYPGRLNYLVTASSVSVPVVVAYGALWRRLLSSPSVGTSNAITSMCCFSVLSCALIAWQLRVFGQIRRILASTKDSRLGLDPVGAFASKPEPPTNSPDAGASSKGPD